MSGSKGHEPVRICIVCRNRQHKRALARLVITEGRVMVDERKILPGRGAYLCDNEKCLDMAAHNYRNCLNRAFRTGNFRVCLK